MTLVSVTGVPKSALKGFDCGVEALDEFLARYALKNDRLGIGRTFVAVDGEGSVAGYFTLATAQVAFSEIPEESRARLPKYPIPAIRIARLAVGRSGQGRGVGRWLLSQAFMKIVRVAEVAGLYFIIVDANESSRGFFERYGFRKFADKELSYFIPVETVRKAVRGE